jgi:hypothetical protein
MDVRLVDRWRNVTKVPTKTPGDDKFAALRDLAKGYVGNVHAEFEMDQAFFRALEALAKAEADAGKTENVLIEMQDGRNLPSFLDIPIVVEGGHAAEMSPAAFKGE